MTATSSYSLETFPSGGLLLDLESGDLFTLNPSATFIWERWLEGTPVTSIAATLAASHDLPVHTAEQHVSNALQVDPSGADVRRDLGEFIYERSTTGYVFSRNGAPILQIDEKESSLRLSLPSTATQREIAGALLAISPKLLALTGDFVLHASGVVVDGAITAFSGESGAGKTTTARALVRAGAAPFCEDKLVVRERNGHAEGLIAIEPRIQVWAENSARNLADGGSAPMPRLDPDGAWAPLREIGFIDAVRRGGNSIGALALSPSETASRVFRNAFWGSDLPAHWRRQLKDASMLARAIRAFDLAMPNGLAPLGAAAAEIVQQRPFRGLAACQIATMAS